MLIITDEQSLNALLKVLWTVKFDSVPEEVTEIAGSPFVAEIYNRTYDAMILAARNAGNEDLAHRLEEERSAEKRTFELNVVHIFIRLARHPWNRWTYEEKLNYVRILLSPYITTEEFLNDIVAEGNRLNLAE